MFFFNSTHWLTISPLERKQTRFGIFWKSLMKHCISISWKSLMKHWCRFGISWKSLIIREKRHSRSWRQKPLEQVRSGKKKKCLSEKSNYNRLWESNLENKLPNLLFFSSNYFSDCSHWLFFKLDSSLRNDTSNSNEFK